VLDRLLVVIAAERRLPTDVIAVHETVSGPPIDAHKDTETAHGTRLSTDDVPDGKWWGRGRVCPSGSAGVVVRGGHRETSTDA
jgi:hypothetical protein